MSPPAITAALFSGREGRVYRQRLSGLFGRATRTMGIAGSTFERKERGSLSDRRCELHAVMCNHCDDAPCMKVAAKNGAITQARRRHRHHRSGKIQRSERDSSMPARTARFTGTRKNRFRRHGFSMHICLTTAGRKPAQSRCCPTERIQVGQGLTIAEMQRIKEQERSGSPAAGAAVTKPRIYYKNLHLMTKCFVGGSVVAQIEWHRRVR